MKKKRIGIQVVSLLIGCLILSITSICSAADDNVLRTQGLINPGGNLKAGYLLINEMRIYVDRVTQVMDDRGVLIPVTELKPKRWIYVELEKDPVRKTIKARKIYLLPHYVSAERQKYSFMK
jgi:hypothetical protein